MAKQLIACVLLSLTLTGCNSKNPPPEIRGMVFIPGGEKSIGSDTRDPYNMAKEFGSRVGGFYENEKPVHKVYLKGYYIDLAETTNFMYQKFILATGYPAPNHWEGTRYRKDLENHPVLNISWYEADTYCRWAGKRLPTEEEWETASKGPDGNIYPWGNVFDVKKANLSLGHTAEVGSMKDDRSYYGVYDMAGNLMEWTSSWYEPYPGSTFKSPLLGKKRKVIKGGFGSGAGHYKLGTYFSRSTFRNSYKPDGKGVDIGFRCARDTPSD